MSTDPHASATVLAAWLDEPITRASLSAARAACDELATLLLRQPALRDELAPYLTHVFVRTGYLKDYRALQQFARRTNRPELLADVDAVVREELPDVWIATAIERGEVEAAIDCWFEHEEHDRARLCAKKLIAACPGRTDILVSGRLRLVVYNIGRGTRSRYRRACNILTKLRSELDRAGEASTWTLVMEDLLGHYGHRPALIDELEKAALKPHDTGPHR